jgi:outer membrane protein insertion porin family
LTLPLLAATALCAQTTYSAKHIVFMNPGLFSQKQLEDTSGMHAGSTADATTMQAAAQRLVDTGYFDDIGVVLDGSAANVSVVFTLKPTPVEQMLPTGFDNFVWLTHDEVEAAIHAKLPLFIDYLTEGSAQADTVAAALTEALAAKGITAKVGHENIEPTLAHPLRTMEFRITSPYVTVANIKLSGVSLELKPLVQKSVNGTARTPYNEGLNGLQTKERILAPLLDAGYVEAALGDEHAEAAPVSGGMVPVVVSGTLQPGEMYHVSALDFSGAPLLSADAFHAAAKLHPGDVASRKALLETLAPLDAAYRRQGYMDVVVKATPKFDEVAHTVAYTVTVDPGEQYRVHDVTPVNLDAARKAAFDRSFTMKTGELYNPEYVEGFLKSNSALKEFAEYNAAFKAYAYPSTHTVDVIVTFAGPSSINVR